MPRTQTWFDYQVPSALEGTISVGDYVSIPFRNKTIEGLVYKLTKTSSVKNCKSITGIIESEMVSGWHLQLIPWFAKYYSISFSHVLTLFLPEPLKRSSAYKPFKPKEVIPQLHISKQTIKDIKWQQPTHEWDLYAFSSNSERLSYYAKAISYHLLKNKSLLLLVPSVAELYSLYTSLGKELQSKVIVHTSEVNKSQNWQTWQQAKVPGTIILGTRTSCFLPMPAKNTIIVDQAERIEYKQTDQNPRFSVWEVIDHRIKHEKNINVLYTGFAPKIEHYTRLQKLKQALKQDDPKSKLAFFTKQGSLKHGLPEQIQQSIQVANNICIYLNRKGSSTAMQCSDCASTIRCNDDGTVLTLHTQKGYLKCHECSKQYPIPSTCNNCSSTLLKGIGIGTQNIESQFKNLTLKHTITRLDRDDETTQAIDYKNKNVVITTDYGLHKLALHMFDLFIMLDGDTELMHTDFRSMERLYQKVQTLRYQLSEASTLLIHTSHTEDSHWQIITSSYEKFWKQEMKARRQYKYPPYSKLTKLIYSDTNKAYAEKETKRLHALLTQKRFTKHDIFPPQKNRPFHEHSKYYYMLLVRSQIADIKNILPFVPDEWLIDRDPEKL